MAVPKLSEADQRSWQSLRNLDNEDLYVILGALPGYHEPTSTPEGLLVGLMFDKSAAAIRDGKKVVRQLLTASRSSICKLWASIKKRSTSSDEKVIVAIVSEGIKPFIEPSAPFGAMPAALLICRGCSYSLDALCTTKASK